MSITINQFNVIDTTSGLVDITGRYDSSQINNMFIYNTFTIGINNKIQVPGTPTTISSTSLLYNKSHLSTNFIHILKNTEYYNNNTNIDSVYVPDNILRIVYLGGQTSATNTVIYGFAPSSSTLITNINWNVLMAVNKVHTIGDYWDIELPDSTFYPDLYLSIIVLNGAWKIRNIINNNICSVNYSLPSFCINPSVSTSDSGLSHFIVLQGYNSNANLLTRLLISVEDWYSSSTDNDYNDIIFSISGKHYDNINVNETQTW